MKRAVLLMLCLLLALAPLPWGGLAEGEGGEGEPEVVVEGAEDAPGEDEGEILADLEGVEEEPEAVMPTAEPEPTRKPGEIPWLTSFNYPDGKTDFEDEIWSIMTRKWGLADFQAAGLMSSIQAESGFCPYNAQGIGGADDRGHYLFRTDDSVGFGLCQWTSSGRKSALRSLAASRGSEDLVWDFDTQMSFMGGEIDLKSLKTAETLYDVTEWAVLRYERPSLAIANSWPGTRYEKGKAIYQRHTGKPYDEPALHFAATVDGESAISEAGVRWGGVRPPELTVRSNYYWRLEQIEPTVEGWLDLRCPSPYRPDELERCVCGYASDGHKPVTFAVLRWPDPGETYAATLRFEIFRGEHVFAEVPVAFTCPEVLRPCKWLPGLALGAYWAGTLL